MKEISKANRHKIFIKGKLWLQLLVCNSRPNPWNVLFCSLAQHHS